MRLSKDELLSISLLVAGLAGLLLLLPGLFTPTAPPLQVAFGWGAFVVVAGLVGAGVGLSLARELARRSAWWRDRWVSSAIPSSGWRMLALAEVLLLLLLVLTHLATGQTLEAALSGLGGGLVGWAGSALLSGLLGRPAGLGIVLAGTALVAWFLGRELLAVGAVLQGGKPGQESRDRFGGVSSFHERLAGGLAWWWGQFILVWKSGRALFVRVLRGMLPARPGPVVEEGSPSPARRRKTAADGRPRDTSAPQAAEAPSAAMKGSGKPTALKQSTAKERPPRSKPRPDTLPPLTLLRPDQSLAGSAPDIRLRAQILRQTLAEFGVPVEVISIKEGPTVTQFGLEPGEVVRELRNGEVQRRRVAVHSILRLSNDLALALSAPTIRIEAPVPGRPYVGVEVPNTEKTLVSLRSVLESNEFARVASPLAAALGRDVSGDPVALDLSALPHLLIAGATGSGKSVCINSIVCSLLMSNDPVTVRLVMVDPKMVELPAYNGVPHLVGPVITDPALVPGALAWLTLQMDERYRVFADSGVRNIAGYNRKAAKSRNMEPLPYLVLVVDELADLMMSTAFDIERQICRLAQLSRATGIHLVLATQRPSVDVITGLIKANFPARIAFAVTTQIDSRVILDSPGAEKLLGRGDMLYMAPDSAKLSRIQGCFVADREIDAIVAFWRTSYEDADLRGPALAPWADVAETMTEHDALLEQALQLVRTKSNISTSLLQRQLRIGFPRAARLMEQLEEMGFVGPPAGEGGSRTRRVLAEQIETSDRVR